MMSFVLALCMPDPVERRMGYLGMSMNRYSRLQNALTSWKSDELTSKCSIIPSPWGGGESGMLLS